MRTGEDPVAVSDQLLARGQVVVHSDDAARVEVLAAEAATTGALVVADTRERVAELNAAVRDQRVAAALVNDQPALITDADERVGVGDRIATRPNDYDLGVANRDAWTVTAIDDDGTLHLGGPNSRGAEGQTMPVGYATEHVELAYASTAYGAQGETVKQAHLLLSENTGAASAYVAMTRGPPAWPPRSPPRTPTPTRAPTRPTRSTRTIRIATGGECPEPAQVKALLDGADERFGAFVAVCAFAGLRLGEAAALRFEDVDFLRRQYTSGVRSSGQAVAWWRSGSRSTGLNARSRFLRVTCGVTR